jgi:hypothetical protein
MFDKARPSFKTVHRGIQQFGFDRPLNDGVTIRGDQGLSTLEVGSILEEAARDTSLR